MKFTYEKPEEKPRKTVAYLFNLSGDPNSTGLCIKGKCGETLWIYHDGDIQQCDGSLWQPEDDWTIKRFYEGDSVTITF